MVAVKPTKLKLKPRIKTPKVTAVSLDSLMSELDQLMLDTIDSEEDSIGEAEMILSNAARLLDTKEDPVSEPEEIAPIEDPESTFSKSIQYAAEAPVCDIDDDSMFDSDVDDIVEQQSDNHSTLSEHIDFRHAEEEESNFVEEQNAYDDAPIRQPAPTAPILSLNQLPSWDKLVQSRNDSRPASSVSHVFYTMPTPISRTMTPKTRNAPSYKPKVPWTRSHQPKTYSSMHNLAPQSFAFKKQREPAFKSEPALSYFEPPVLAPQTPTDDDDQSYNHLPPLIIPQFIPQYAASISAKPESPPAYTQSEYNTQRKLYLPQLSRLGGLGPSTDDKHEQLTQKVQRQKEYAIKVKLPRKTGVVPKFEIKPDHGAKQMAVYRRDLRLNYAKSIPKPKTVSVISPRRPSFHEQKIAALGELEHQYSETVAKVESIKRSLGFNRNG